MSKLLTREELEAFRDVEPSGPNSDLDAIIATARHYMAEAQRLKPAADAWNLLFTSLEALTECKHDPKAPRDATIDSYIEVYRRLKAENQRLAAVVERVRLLLPFWRESANGMEFIGQSQSSRTTLARVEQLQVALETE